MVCPRGPTTRSGTGETRSRRTVDPPPRASAATSGTIVSLRDRAPTGTKIRFAIVDLLPSYDAAGRSVDSRERGAGILSSRACIGKKTLVSGRSPPFVNAPRNTAGGAEIARRSVELDGRRVSYLVAGDPATAPTILLIHGSGVSARYWDNQLQRLAGALRVVAIALPGHGASEPMPPTQRVSVEAYGEVVASFLDALGAGPVIVAGHSLGGAIAIALAARRPDAVSALLLLSSCAKLPPADGPGERFLAA